MSFSFIVDRCLLFVLVTLICLFKHGLVRSNKNKQVQKETITHRLDLAVSSFVLI